MYLKRIEKTSSINNTEYLLDMNRVEIYSSNRDSIKKAAIGGLKFSHVDKYKVLHFRTKSLSVPGKEWYQTIKLLDFSKIDVNNYKNRTNAMRRLLNGNISLYCSCPQFKYGGYKYIAYLNNYGSRKETRYPGIRNPTLSGRTCKHLHNILKILPKYDEALSSIFSYKGFF